MDADAAATLIRDRTSKQELIEALALPLAKPSRPGAVNYGTALIDAAGLTVDDGQVVDRATLLVANVFADELAGSVICVGDTGPVHCSEAAPSYELAIPGGHVAKVPIAPAVETNAISILIVPAGEERRPIVLSGARRFRLRSSPAPVKSPVEPMSHHVMDPRDFGCGQVWLVDDLDLHHEYAPLRDLQPHTPMWAVFEACAGERSSTGQLVAVLDGNRAEMLGSGSYGFAGSTTAIQLPDEVLRGARSVQVVLLPTAFDVSPMFSLVATFDT